jgi:hypothetical protein
LTIRVGGGRGFLDGLGGEGEGEEDGGYQMQKAGEHNRNLSAIQCRVIITLKIRVCTSKFYHNLLRYSSDTYYYMGRLYLTVSSFLQYSNNMQIPKLEACLIMD